MQRIVSRTRSALGRAAYTRAQVRMQHLYMLLFLFQNGDSTERA